MVLRNFFLILIGLTFSATVFAQSDNFRFVKYLNEHPMESTAFAVRYEGQKTLETLRNNHIVIKSISPNWVFIQTTPEMIDQLSKSKQIQQFYFKSQYPKALGDTAWYVQHTKEVNEGFGDLHMPYKGKGVIVGFVDEGIDWTHPDFRDSNDVPRVIAYWDQTKTNDSTTPQPYNYGQSCDSLSIANGTCPLVENNTYHGSTVAGAAVGNARATGKHRGSAPEAKIIMIKTDFSKQNWALTVADACQYVFHIADSLHRPAVMNLSVGDYLGSHDGLDPAAELMKQMVTEKSGRIILGAMGNSGNKGDYHLKGKIVGDTNFVWFKNNPTNQVYHNSVYFDWWSDTTTSNNLNVGFAAVDPVTFAQTPYTNFFNVKNVPLHWIDTLRLPNGQKLGIVELYKTPMDSRYEIEVLIRDYDSLQYYYQLGVSGNGQFDLWSGQWMQLNDMVTNLPSPSVLPEIVHYMHPDSLSTLVDSWASSPDFGTVGNLKNRQSYLNYNGQMYSPADSPFPVGYIHPSSSRGPNRFGDLKPDVASYGDMMLGPAPAFMRLNSAYGGVLDAEGWHARNGGTSMATPVVSGIAALYLEKCKSATNAQFVSDLDNNTDIFTYYGMMPNYTYGNGRVNAYKLLLHNGEFSNDMGYCGADFQLGIKSVDNPTNFLWSTGATTPTVTISSSDTIAVTFNYGANCYSQLSKVIGVGAPPIQPIITQNGNVLTSTPAYAYQWFHNGMEMSGETNQSLTIVSGGFYQVKVSDSVGCSNYSDNFHSTLSLEQLKKQMRIFPNPAQNQLQILSDLKVTKVEIYSIDGKMVKSQSNANSIIDISEFVSGTYLLKIYADDFMKTFKFIKE